MPDTPAPSEFPLHSLEYFWERITFGTLTDDDAAAMWKFMVDTARAAGSTAVDDPRAATSRVDFKKAVGDVNSRGDPGERVALALLVQGASDDAAARLEAIAARAGDERSDRLWCKGALFAPTAPAIARDAWERVLQLRPDFHYLGFALGEVLERLGDRGGATAAYQAVASNATDDKELQAWAVDNLGDMARRRGDHEGAVPFLERSLQLYRELNDPLYVYHALLRLAESAVLRAQPVLAEGYLKQALDVARRQLSDDDVQSVLALLAAAAQDRGG